MNEQLQAELLKIVTNISNGAESIWGFLTDQTPEVVRQLLLWHGIHSLIWFVVFLIAAVLPLLLMKPIQTTLKNNAKKAREDYENGEPWTRYEGFSGSTSIKYDNIVNMEKFPILGIACGFSIFFECCALHSLTWLKIWLAPKMWLLEYITAMVK